MGGFGSIGTQIATFISQQVRANLIFIGRSELSQKQQQQITQLQNAGTEVLYLQADVANLAQMKEVITSIKRQYGVINGVIQASGVLEDKLLINKDWKSFERVLAPKVQGTWILNQLTQNEPLDFFVVFSSIVAVTGNIGQVDYATANSFLDTFIHYRSHNNYPGKSLSINWTLWAEGGMGQNPLVVEAFSQKAGVISSQAGLKAFVQVLGGTQCQYIVVGKKHAFEPKLAPKDKKVTLSDNIEPMQKELIHLLSQIIETPPSELDTDTDIREYGLDSISLTDYADKLNQQFGLSVNPTLFYEFPNLQALSEHLVERYDLKLTQEEDMTELPVLKVSSVEPKQAIKPFVETPSVAKGQEVAIIGMSGRFPGAKNLVVFWENLIKEKDLISEIPEERWDWRAYFGDPQGDENKTNSKWGGFLDDVKSFDAAFFHISPREAELMDPQQRLLLEEVWHVIEEAGYNPRSMSGTDMGIFIGVCNDDYNDLLLENNIKQDAYTSTGSYFSIIPNRISYFLDVHGPSVAIDTACSSSLVALHQAVQALAHEDCTLAIAGGVNLCLTPKRYCSFSHAGMLSPDGRCKTFDKSANGYVRGEGVGVILLKPLTKAITDGDHIYGVIKGSAVNHGGYSNSLTAPNPNAQAALLVNAYKKANIPPETVTYIEAHGTGTSLGDPIEINGLKAGFEKLYQQGDKPTPQQAYCGIGAVKTNIGHLESAAGIAGVIKVLLAMKHQKLPASIHFKELNPYIELEKSPFFLVNQTQSWGNNQSIPRRAGVSSFGFGGANAHIVLEEYVSPTQPLVSKQSPLLIVLSAKNTERLIAYAKEMVIFLEKTEMSFSLTDIAYTLQVGREAMVERLAMVVSSVDDLKDKITQYVQGKTDIKDFYQNNVKQNKAQIDLLIDGKAGEAFLKIAIEEKELTKLAQLWVSGVDIDWQLLYPNQKPQRISLPTYPFAKERYWISTPLKKTTHILENKGEDGQFEHYPTTFPSLFEDTVSQIKLPPLDISQMEKAFNELTRFAQELLLNAFQRMGVFQCPGDHYDIEKLSEQLNIVPAYTRLFEALLEILEQAAFVERTGKSIITTQALNNYSLPSDLTDFEEKRHHLVDTYPELKPYVRLLWTCLRAYPDILRGQIPATEIMFPHSSMELVEGIYQGNANSDYFNQIVVQSVQSYIQARRALSANHEKIKILEVGAGTGGTSALVLEAIDTYREHLSYMYTDISVGFLQYGKQHYGQCYPFVDFGIFNVETSIKVPGYELGDFDVIIAANVLHATRNIHHTISHLKALLKTHGCLILNELTGKQAFVTLTFGLLEGWWLFEDTDNRLSGSPLLSASMWDKFLKKEGFEQVASLGQPPEISSQHIIIAESNGDVWHRTTAPIKSEIVQPIQLAPMMKQQAKDDLSPVSVDSQQITPPPSVNKEVRQYIEDIILECVGKSLGMDTKKIDLESSFSEYGVDSIIGVELVNKVNQALGVQIRTTALFDYVNVKGLSDYIYDEYGVKISEPMGTEKTSVEFQILPQKPGNVLSSQLNSTEKVFNQKAGFSFQGGGALLDQEIAIIGMSGRFPDAKNVNEFWHNLSTGKNSIIEVPKERWDIADYYDPDPQKLDKTHCKWGAFLDDIDQFDPLFFNISGKEAELSDPQQRLFLEETWAALEDAGYANNTISNQRCAVFVGVLEGDYQLKIDRGDIGREAQSMWGNSSSILAARISYFLNLKGPSIAIDTACSSSLVAIHLACQSILMEESDMAIAGGIFVGTTPKVHILASNAEMLAPDGQCKTFDNAANGFVLGEGIGIVILKPLQTALRDRDHIYGVIKGSGINQDGKTNGITAPSTLSQTELELSVYKKFSIDPKTISYVEAHGTGTKLGDPIEIEALTNAFKKYTDQKQYCAIGSVKTNIGHGQHAAGVAGVIKILLALKHQQIPPSLNFNQVNEHIHFTDSPFYVNTQLNEWKTEPGIARRAAISSFGFSGTNAHLVIEEYNNRPPSLDLAGNEQQLFVLSAKNEERLQAYVKAIIDFLTQTQETDVAPKSVAVIDNAELRQVQPDLLNMVSNILKVNVEDIDLEEAFSEYGFDTVNLTEFAHRLNDKYQLSVTPTLFSEHTSIGAMTQYVCEQFQANVQKKTTTVESSHNSPRFLADMAYTLQIGREAMKERLAMVACSLEEVREKLTQYLEGQTNIKGFYYGNVKTSQTRSEMLIEGEAGEAFLRVVIEKKEFNKLAQLWVSGIEIDWNLLYSDYKPQRISLPTYPFAKKRYWIPEIGSKKKVVGHELRHVAQIHPFLRSNISTFTEQKFTTQLNGEEFYLTDHVIADQKMLPGVAYLEMARAAGTIAGERNVRKLTNIVWVQPIIVSDTPQTIHISLSPDDQLQQVIFEVSSHLDDNQQKQVHAQGILTYESQPVSETIDIEAIQKRCSDTLNNDECYKLFQTLGFKYGPRFQTIKTLYRNNNEALSCLQLPKALKDGFNDFVLHPSLMDSALQTVIGLVHATSSAPLLPFAVGEVELVKPLSEQSYIYVRRAEHSSTVDSAVTKFNIFIMDETGFVSVRMKDFSARALKQAGDTLVTMYYQNLWKSSALDEQTEPFTLPGTVLLFDTNDSRYMSFKESLKNEIILVTPGERYQVLGTQTYSINPNQPTDYQKLLGALNDQNSLPNYIIHLWSQAPFASEPAALNTQLNLCLLSIFHLSQALLEQKPVEPIQLLYIYLENEEGLQPQYAALSGFAKTIRLENSKFRYKTVALPTLEKVNDIVLAEFQASDETEIRYDNTNQRWVKRLQEVNEIPEAGNTTHLKEQGVYLITGGAGGLGLIFAEYLAKNFQAKLVLTGRSDLIPEKVKHIQLLSSLGAEVFYQKADVAKRNDVEEVIAQTKSRFGHINGIIHAAGVIQDTWIVKKTPNDIVAVLASKVFGTLNLDEVTQNEPLDFFVLFSSMASVVGNVGQCDYAYANGFMDHFAAWRSGLEKQQKRFGKTLSINWPLWRSGGMRVDEQTEKWLANTLGMQPMSTETGIAAFCQGLKWKEINQLMVLEGYRAKVRKGLGIETAVSKATTVSKVPAQTDQLLEKLQKDLLTVISAILKISPKDIDLSDDVSEYGFDSISFTEFANQINDKYQLSITPAIFFEYSSVDTFSRFLCDEYQGHFLDYYIDSLKVESTPSLVTETTDIEETVDLKETVKLRNRFVKPVTVQDDSKCLANTPIAIIGQSGIMPQSEDLESFWQHLDAGDDLITEVPIERWDWQETAPDNELSVHTNKVKWGGFMPAVDQFDPLFFGISPREAKLMDPQQRLFLETVWKTIEDAGYKASDLSGSQTGLFVGVATNDYLELLKESGLDIEAYAPTGTAHSIVANRISYLLNLHGPSEPINTACSSALVAIHRAVEAIRRGICEMAIAGGVNVMSTPTLTIAFSKVDVLSEDGCCRVFDKQANGYVRSEGVGAILLKPLSQAQADGDTIYAVIRGTAENHGGHATSLTAPNPNAQTQLLISAYENADLDPSTISYIEAHSTGTNLGDPIEINGLKNAFAELYKKYGKSFPKEPHCGIGSVKTNIGHLEAASGMAGVFKVLFAMKHNKLPGLLHFYERNPYIQLHDSPFYLVTENQTWTPLTDNEGQKIPRRAGVSTFGFGGANAHIVLEEYEQKSLPVVDEPTQLMVLSAKNSERLGAIAQQMLNFLSKKPDILLSNLTYTLQVGREAMDERLAMVVENIEEVKDKLAQYVQGQTEIKLCYRGNVKSNRAQSQLLIEGEEGRDFVESLIKNRKLTKLAQLWVLGVDIDWQLIYSSNKPQRIPLPTYPFARERYWVPVSKTSQPNRESLPLIAQTQSAAPDLTALSANKQLTQATPNERYTRILTRMHDLLSAVTGFSHIESEDNLIESGIDSISAVEFKDRLEKTYGITLSTTFLRDYPTLHKITGYFVQQLPPAAGTIETEKVDFEQPLPPTIETDTGVKFVTEDEIADNFKEMADFTYRFASELKGRRAKIDGQWYIDYGSCNYLGFDWHPYIMDAVRPALAQWGVHPPWSRTVASPQIYQELEMKLAELVEAPYVDVFPTVTLLNMGLMPELIGPEDTLFIDQYAHNCLQKAAALCHERGSRVVIFRHNDVAYLERKMKEVSLPSKKKLVVVDGIYSLDGTHAPLPELVELGKRYNAWIMVDDSHGFGILGEQPSSEFPYGKRGNGIAKYYGLDYGRDGIIYVGQLSKAYSTMGGFVAYSDPKIKTAVQNAFSMIFSGPLPTASLATGIAGLEINEREGEKARATLLERTRMLIHGLHELGYTIDSLPDSHLIRVTLGAQPTSVEFLRKLMVDERIIVTPAVYPAVEWTNTGLRFMVTALHTEEDIAETLASMKKLVNIVEKHHDN
jgi:acyl transferase domain-containing protein/7-keto-8-aminopelargonate synthetase-like enzyme/acyl carrier protein/2-polyprenyl-3-methyl-5-hydroxy-6-metoxy-1,4-benzoquinol methylase